MHDVDIKVDTGADVGRIPLGVGYLRGGSRRRRDTQRGPPPDGARGPDFGNRAVLLATAEDGKTLAQPRLVVPGDVKGGRYVTDVVGLHVVRAG